MHIKLIASSVIAALLLTGTGYAVSNDSGQGAQLQQPVETTAPTVATTLTEEQAISIALEHAGLAEIQIRGLDTKFDRDRGVPEWDVDFNHNGWEYSYEIHAETGKILDFEKEWDD